MYIFDIVEWLHTCLIMLLLVLVACHLLSAIVDFLLLLMHIGFYFESADDTYSVHVARTDSYL